VQDEVDAGKRIEHFGSHESVRVGDQSYRQQRGFGLVGVFLQRVFGSDGECPGFPTTSTTEDTEGTEVRLRRESKIPQGRFFVKTN
jgi:hypothetical protein